MNLKTHISQDLWLSIESTYESKNYSHSIIDAMHYLSNLLREKANVDGDGVGLVGKVLGGDTPRIRVNKLQTETERDIQKGLEQILRGLYQGIRNPRSHEQIEDNQDTADAIIYFINYLIDILIKSEEPFTIKKFIPRIFDPDFVKSTRYAELLTAEIPENKVFDTLIEIYRRKEEGDGNKLIFIVKTILDRLNQEQQASFLEVVSDELKTTSNENSIIISLQILPIEFWNNLNEISRLRIENKIINSLIEGKVDFISGNIYQNKGLLGILGRNLFVNFRLKQQLQNVIFHKINVDDIEENLYIFEYFINLLPVVFESGYSRDLCIHALSKGVINDIPGLRGKLLDSIKSYPGDWKSEIIKNLKSLESSDPFYYNGLLAAEPEY